MPGSAGSAENSSHWLYRADACFVARRSSHLETAACGRDTLASVPRVSAFFGTSTRWPKIGSVTDVLPLVHVTGVAVIGDHRLRLLFEDGTVGDVGFADREWRGVFEPLRDPDRFARVTVEHGTIVWPADGLDMAPEPLYQAALAHPVPAAGVVS